MAQAHLDRLTSIDAGFLHQEDEGAHMHIGGLAVFEGPAPTGDAFREHLQSRLHLVPRYRQKVVPMPFGTGRPLWAEDSSFRIGYHVRHTALPSPGTWEQLLTLTSRVVSQRLDRTKPLWELWLVEGLEAGRWAVVSKTHHAMVDGIGGVDIMATLLDLTPEPRTLEPAPWLPRSAPGTAGLLALGAVGALRGVARLAARSASLALHPSEAVRGAASTAAALGAFGLPFLDGAPPTPLNRRPGPHRRLEVVRTSLADHKQVKQALGGTVNDVVLTAVAGALGRFLSDRDVHVEGLRLRACVPVSVRTQDRRDAAGNAITIMAAPLPVGVPDPVDRLAEVRRAMAEVKSSRQALGAQVLTSVVSALPPVVLARASRLGFSSRLYNLLVTNVPGPQFPIYLLGRRMEELVPLAFLAPKHRLAIAIVSYDGAVTYGLLGDADALPDLPQLAQYLRESLEELVGTARRRTAASAPTG